MFDKIVEQNYQTENTAKLFIQKLKINYISIDYQQYKIIILIYIVYNFVFMSEIISVV